MKIRPVLLTQRNILAGLLLFNLLIVTSAFYNTLQDLVQLWLKFDQSLGHGLLVIATSLFLICKTIDWKAETAEPDLKAALPVAALSLIWALAYSVDINIIEQLLIPGIIFFSVQLLVGIKISKKLIIPISLLYFSIPVWDYLNSILLFSTATIVQWLVRLSDITAYIEGTSIFLASGEILIAEGCSGLRYFIIALFLSVLSGYLFFRSLTIRVLIILLGVLLALLANWLRVYLIIIIAYISDMQSSLVAQHELLGWIVFILFMLPIFYISYKYQNGHMTINDNKSTETPTSTNTNKILVALILLIPSIFSGQILLKAEHFLSDNKRIDGIEIPSGNDLWSKRANGSDLFWMTTALGNKDRVSKEYTNNQVNIDLTVFEFMKEKQYGQLVPYIASIYNMDDWSLESEEIIDISSGDTTVSFNKAIIINKYARDRVVLFYKYKVGGLNTNSYWIAKLYQIPANLTGYNSAYLVILSSRCFDSCDNEEDAIRDYVMDMAHNFD